MISRWMRAAWILLLVPVTALAFETVDSLPFPSSGRFPAAWPGDTERRPTQLWAYGGLMYDSNPLRRFAFERSDTVARAGVGASHEQRVYSRQSVLLEGNVEYYHFNRFSRIDHIAYFGRAEWLWELGNDLSGTAGYTRRRRHADLGEFQTETRIMILDELLFASGAWRFIPDWRLIGGLEYGSIERDVQAVEVNRTTARGGLEYVTPLGNAIGVEARFTRGQAPIAETIGAAAIINDFDETEYAATLRYRLGEQLRIAGRFGQTVRSYDQVPGRDFSGATYRGRVDWQVEPKLLLSFEGFREPASVIDIDASHVLRTGTLFGVSWAATYKLVFSLRWVNEHRLYEGTASVVLLGTPPRDERLQVWRFGAGWEPQRNWQIGAGFDLGERNSNQLGRDYDYRAWMLNLRVSY